MNSCHDNRLTIYNAGRIRELWTISWPMIIACATNCILLLVDRIVLSHYSQEAFNTSVECFPWFLGFWFTFFSLIGVTEIFVGQNNGARQFHKIGEIVWQMIWFSFSTYLIFLPVCTYGPQYMLASSSTESAKYLKIILLYSPISYATFGALGSFFVGRGKTKFITFLSFIASVENAILDILLVFGYCNFPQLGTVGAAYATLISHVTVFIISLIIFLSPNNHKKYHTWCFKLNLKQLRTCLSVGVPFAISSFINCFAFAFLIKILAKYSSSEEFTIFGITHSFYGVLLFFADGISRGVSTLCSNYIGAQKIALTKNVLLSSIKLQCIFASILFLILIFFTNKIISIIFPSICTLVNETTCLMFIVYLCLFLDGIVLYLQALLLSAGDTKFIMISTLCVFLFSVIIPGYIGITQFHIFSKFLWYLFTLDSCERILIFYLRYKSSKWKKLNVSQA